MPTQRGWLLVVDEGTDGVLGDVGGEQEEGDRDEPLRALFGVFVESARTVNRQITMSDASASITESSPKPSNATEPARIAVVIPLAPSAVMQASDSHERVFAGRISRSRSRRSTGAGAAGAMCRTGKLDRRGAHCARLGGEEACAEQLAPGRGESVEDDLPVAAGVGLSGVA
jgi:hypothetical protein